jgi:hypothetical protein
MAGMCLRGKPGWGDLGASFTTVLNTFGGTWWSANPDGSVGQAQVNMPAFKNALQFYVNLIHSAGEKDAANSSFNECLTQYMDGKVAMWYDATVAASNLEASNSPAFAKPTLEAIAAAPIKDPGTTPRPGLPGVQYVGIPQFQDVGNQCTQQFSAVIAGSESIDSALKNCQSIAAQVKG